MFRMRASGWLGSCRAAGALAALLGRAGFRACCPGGLKVAGCWEGTASGCGPPAPAAAAAVVPPFRKQRPDLHSHAHRMSLISLCLLLPPAEAQQASMHLTPEPVSLDGGVHFHVPAANGDLCALRHVEAVLHLLPGNDLAFLRHACMHQAHTLILADHVQKCLLRSTSRKVRSAIHSGDHGEGQVGAHLIIQRAAARLHFQHSVCEGLVFSLLFDKHTGLSS